MCYKQTMPVHVDHAARRGALADAVWRLVLRDGVAGASVRAVAREAGLSVGSVRHFFNSQDALLQFAMREVIDRARGRVAAGVERRLAAARAGDPLGAVRAALEEVLPLDQSRLVEARIWAAFVAASPTDPQLQEIRQEADVAVRGLCRDMVRALVELGAIDADTDVKAEADGLWALLDGLTLHLLLERPVTRPAQARRVLRRHLERMAVPADTAARPRLS